ncbi:anti-sigma factor RsbA family regulatory protein [Qaidamihabitans albus]|uniref:anti-sigma factor RsbA family regulatory protein n=1 Tax=Qaidamihabitans albus TaxID=2795733 RepID=UPI0018F11B79|nr:anti-sigma factor RsbA family regulatory protein [Qaidamihabitans albus]
MSAIVSSGMRAGDFAHEALVYRGEAELLAGTVPFVLGGLAGGEPVAVAVPEPNLRLIEAELGDSAQDVRLIDMSEAGRNPGRIIPGVLRAFADAHQGRVRIIGEPVWPDRSSEEYPACLLHEALINDAFAGRDATILCPYDGARLELSVLRDAEATHPVWLKGGERSRSERYAPDEVVATCNVALPAPPDAESIEFDIGGLARARAFAAGKAAELGLSRERFDDLALIVGELCGNSVQHGGGRGTLRVWPEGDQVICQVEDAGRLDDPLAGRRPAALDSPGGRGLLLVNHLADLVRVHTTPSGTTSRAYLHRDG